MSRQIEASDHEALFVGHSFPERLADLGEIRMNYVEVGNPELPALLLIPAQTESWWGYEAALRPLSEKFHTFAVDVRGQGRSSWTPGRYSLDNWGNDLVRFIDEVVEEPVIVSGNSSGGVIAAWLAAYAKPGQIRGAILEDAPLFASELITTTGPGIRQGMGLTMALSHKWLGDQWSIGDWAGMQRAAMAGEIPTWLAKGLTAMANAADGPPDPNVVPQNMREYDPEFGLSFYNGTATRNVSHEQMLSAIRVPILLTHHFHEVDGETGAVLGALTDQQAARARELVTRAGQVFTTRDLPGMAHQMHQQDPQLFADIVDEFAVTLDSDPAQARGDGQAGTLVAPRTGAPPRTASTFSSRAVT